MTEPVATSPRFYGRRQGRPLHVRKTMLMQEFLPKLEIALPQGQILNPCDLFPAKPQTIRLEIGFGGGEHLTAQAMRHPDIGFIGCEPFRNGIASLLDHIDRNALANICIFPNDARLLLDALPDAAIDRCYVLFADPWPKAKHVDRRFIGPENLPRLSRVIKPGGELRLATDDPRLSEWMLRVMHQAEAFQELYNTPIPPEDWVPTRYEQKAIQAGRAPVYRAYRRV